MNSLLVALILASPLTPLPEGEASLVVTIPGLRNDAGTLRCALFTTPEGFPGPSRLDRGQVNVKAAKGSVTCTFPRLPAGTFAISVLHDENDNAKLDSNFFGIPTEGYGVSNNVVPALASPRFTDATFTLSATERRALTITLKY